MTSKSAALPESAAAVTLLPTPSTIKKNKSKMVRIIGGMAGGAVEAVCLQPLDTIKTRLQLSSKPMGTAATAQNIIRNEGFLALYKGLTPFVTHLVSKYALRFYTNEFFRSLLSEKDGHVTKIGGFAAGLATGITEAIVIVTPFEVVKTRLQQQKGLEVSKLKYKNPFHCAKTILAEEGSLALWKGVVPTMTRQGLNQCFLFGCYDMIKQSLWEIERDGIIQPYQALITGIVAGMIGPCVNCPVDVAKTRMMVQQNVPYRGMFHCIYSVYRNEGIRSLYRGLGPRVARVAPGQGITFMVMESVRGLLIP